MTSEVLGTLLGFLHRNSCSSLVSCSKIIHVHCTLEVGHKRADDGGKQAKKEKLEIIPSHLDIMDRDKGQAVKRVDILFEVRDCGITWQFDKPYNIQTLLIMKKTLTPNYPWPFGTRYSGENTRNTVFTESSLTSSYCMLGTPIRYSATVELKAVFRKAA